MALTEVSNPYNIKIAKNLTVEASSTSSYNYDGVYGPIPDPETGLVDLSNYGCKYGSIIQNGFFKEITLSDNNLIYLKNPLKLGPTQNYYFTYSNVSLGIYTLKNNNIDVSNWDTSQVVTMQNMFSMCYYLTSLDVSKWDTSKVTNMLGMFLNCYALTSLDVSNWDTSKVTDMNGMFGNCTSLTTITGAIDMTSCTNCEIMFRNCDKLKGVHLKNVPKSLSMSNIGGTEGVTYIIDNYID